MMKNEYNAAILIVDDLIFIGKRKDEIGPILQGSLNKNRYIIKELKVVPNERQEIVSVLNRWVYKNRLNLILVSGGIGLSPLDETPEVILELVERRFPGIEEELRKGLEDNKPDAILFRGVAGTAGDSLIIALPNEPEMAIECFTLIEPAIRRALQLISGEKNDL